MGCFNVPGGLAAAPAYAERYANLPTDTADLIQRNNGWWLHVVVTVEAPQVAPSDALLGVDLGLARPAVTSQNHCFGKKAWKAREGRLFQLKRALQQKGSRSAKRHLGRVRHKQARFRRDCDHVLSKQIVRSAELRSTIVLEKKRTSESERRRGARPRPSAASTPGRSRN